jgi:hypothetical protein
MAPPTPQPRAKKPAKTPSSQHSATKSTTPKPKAKQGISTTFGTSQPRGEDSENEDELSQAGTSRAGSVAPQQVSYFSLLFLSFFDFLYFAYLGFCIPSNSISFYLYLMF